MSASIRLFFVFIVACSASVPNEDERARCFQATAMFKTFLFSQAVTDLSDISTFQTTPFMTL